MGVKKVKLVIVLLFICLLNSYGQVTIGSGSKPNPGSLLDLKQNDNINENSYGGLLLPRVYLKMKDQLYPMFESNDPTYTDSEKLLHTGLVVYNLATETAEDLCPGPYAWTGNVWQRLLKKPCTSPVSINCTDVYVTGYMNINMNTTTPIAQIPYTLSSGSSHTLSAATIGTYEDIVASVETQTLTSSGNIEVKFSGAPKSVMDKVPFSINITGNTCSIFLSVMTPPSACPDGRTTRAFVFQQGSKWYVLTANGNYNGNRVAETIECDTEEEALRHPEAFQYCSNDPGNRCISLFGRDGVQIGVWLNMTGSSSTWLGGIAQATAGCSEWVKFHEGSTITDLNNKRVGAVNVTNGRGYFGYTSQVAKMSTKGLR